MPDRKFLLLARKRTGSTMLRSALNSHPNISCLGEIFRVDRPLAERKSALKKLRRLTGMDSESPEQVDKFIREHTLQFFDNVLAHDKQLQAFGCKLFLRQHPGLIDDLCRDESARIIHLKRSNILATYSSQLIAGATGRHNVRSKKKNAAASTTAANNRVRETVNFTVEGFEKYRGRVERSNARANKILEAARCKILNIEYVDLLQHNPYQAVLEFLSVNSDFDIQPKTIKGNSSNILLRFSNPDTAMQYLQKEGLTSWVEEG